MKQRLRSEILLKRLKQQPVQKRKKDQKILQLLQKMDEFKKARKILLYLPIHGEVDLSALFDIPTLNKKIVLPRVKSTTTTLILYNIKNLKDVELGAYKILEPKKHLQKVKPEEIDLAFIPGIAFSKDGHRVGYGKGFYDRLMKKLTCPKIGIAYEFQIVNNIPGEKHDVPVDMIITEKTTRISTP
ncbi:MAG TPA: 5-formyltetrahydrofolate cyclo-ligase [Candidatus Gracilibacteria bacterium]|nr:5-formyltetrahydrofolate cyclo-ligase [Candidatus Gracilibacteria bacterium]